MTVQFAPPPKTDFVVDAGPRELAFFAAHGYLVFDRVTTDEELEWLREVYDALTALPRTGFPDMFFDPSRPYGTKEFPDLGQLIRPERFVPRVVETAMWRNAKRIATRLLGVAEEKVENWGHLVLKPPRVGGETPWHQDEAYWEPEKTYHAVGGWMPLDDATIENGCLWFLPGSHEGDVLAHKHLGDDPAVHVLELVREPDLSGAVPVPLKAGGMSFHHPRTLHYARPNTTNGPRRAWANEFQLAPIELAVPADRPWVDEGRRAIRQKMEAAGRG